MLGPSAGSTTAVTAIGPHHPMSPVRQAAQAMATTPRAKHRINGKAIAPRAGGVEPLNVGDHLVPVPAGEGERDQVEHADREVAEAAEDTEGGSQVGQAGAAVPRQMEKAPDGRHHQQSREHEQHGRSQQSACMVRAAVNITSPVPPAAGSRGASTTRGPGRRRAKPPRRSGGSGGRSMVCGWWCSRSPSDIRLTGAVPILQPPSAFGLAVGIGSAGVSVSIEGMTLRAVHITLTAEAQPFCRPRLGACLDGRPARWTWSRPAILTLATQLELWLGPDPGTSRAVLAIAYGIGTIAAAWHRIAPLATVTVCITAMAVVPGALGVDPSNAFGWLVTLLASWCRPAITAGGRSSRWRSPLALVALSIVLEKGFVVADIAYAWLILGGAWLAGRAIGSRTLRATAVGGARSSRRAGGALAGRGSRHRRAATDRP